MTILRIAELIENKHVAGILACIYMRGQMNRTTLYNMVSRNPRMNLKVNSLIQDGFLEEKYIGRMTYLRLTQRGNAVAKVLCDLEAEIYGNVPDPLGFDFSQITDDSESNED